jgi:plastocyanin
MAARRHRGIVVLALSLATISGTAGIADAVTVGVRGVFNGTRYVWSPKVRNVARTTTVRWRAVDGSHNIRSRSANWNFFRSVPIGTSTAKTFNRRGKFRYYCTIHGNLANGVCSGMFGSIVVS